MRCCGCLRWVDVFCHEDQIESESSQPSSDGEVTASGPLAVGCQDFYRVAGLGECQSNAVSVGLCGVDDSFDGYILPLIRLRVFDADSRWIGGCQPHLPDGKQGDCSGDCTSRGVQHGRLIDLRYLNSIDQFLA